MNVYPIADAHTDYLYSLLNGISPLMGGIPDQIHVSRESLEKGNVRLQFFAAFPFESQVLFKRTFAYGVIYKKVKGAVGWDVACESDMHCGGVFAFVRIFSRRERFTARYNRKDRNNKQAE